MNLDMKNNTLLKSDSDNVSLYQKAIGKGSLKSNYGSKLPEKKGPQPILPKQIISPNTLINKSK